MSSKKTYTADEIRRRLRDHKLSRVAKAAGVSKDTLYRLMHGVCEPIPATLAAIGAYLDGDANG
jgi:DNA-binding phage protein